MKVVKVRVKIDNEKERCCLFISSVASTALFIMPRKAREQFNDFVFAVLFEFLQKSVNYFDYVAD